MKITTKTRYGSGALILLASACAVAADSDYPNKPIRVIVPFATGGSTDILIRTVGQRMSESLGQQLLIDNRGGAGGALGAELAAKAPPDGYTIMATTSGVIVANPSLYKKLSYDPVKDFAPVSIVASLPNMLVVPPTMPVKDVRALIALAKARPGQLTYASGGNGTSNHLAGALLNYLAGVDITHVPYKGGGPAVLAVMTGEVAMLFATMPSAMQQVKGGRLKALAVTGRTRSPATPGLPTMLESGVKDFVVSVWIGIVVPRSAPGIVVERLNREVAKALQVPDVIARLRDEGYEPVASTPENMAAEIKTETATWAKVIKAAGIHAD